MFKRVAVVVGLLTLGLVQVASADIIGTVSFENSGGTYASDATIPVYLTLTLDPTSDPLITDGSGNITDLSPAQVSAYLFGTYTDSNGDPILGYSPDPNNDTLNSNTNEGIGCSGTFFNPVDYCGGGTAPYSFNFGPGPGFAFADNLDLLAGSSTTFLLGTFTPDGPNAPAGNYSLPDASYFIQVFDSAQLDPQGNPVHIADISLGGTTTPFTATVTTPEPSFFYGLLGLVSCLLFVCVRRRSAKNN